MLSNIESRDKVHKEISFDKPMETHPKKKDSVKGLRHTSEELFHISYNLKFHLRTITTSNTTAGFPNVSILLFPDLLDDVVNIDIQSDGGNGAKATVCAYDNLLDSGIYGPKGWQTLC
jgi:hypothetical protein